MPKPNGKNSRMPGFLEDISRLRLDRDSGVSRAPLPGVTVLSDEFWTGYDQFTLAYDAFVDAKNVLHVFCPPPINLEDGLVDGFRKAGIGFGGSSRVKNARYFMVIEQPDWPTDLSSVEIDLFERSYNLRVGRQNTERFAGKNTLYAQNKNNKLEWIQDWMRFHHREQDANAVLLVDNGSTEYSPRELLDAMEDVKGFDVITVVSAPLPFIPLPATRRGNDCNFFQPAMHSMLSRRFLRKARAVLSLDIDEMLLKRRHRTVFDAAASSWFGAVCFSGHMVFAIDGSEQTYTAHRFRREGTADHRGKYCYRPDSYMGRGWQTTHMIQGGSRNPICQHLLRTAEFEFLHHHSVSTSWASDRGTHGWTDLIPDPDAAHLASVLEGGAMT